MGKSLGVSAITQLLCNPLVVLVGERLGFVVVQHGHAQQRSTRVLNVTCYPGIRSFGYGLMHPSYI